MKQQSYVAFLRGINVGGHHKVPMADLRKEFENLMFENITTILNSGNVIFDATANDLEKMENRISDHLENIFGFPIPTILRTVDMMNALLAKNPFKEELITKDTRLYITFLRNDPQINLSLPWSSDDQSFKIIDIFDRTIIGILDLSVSNTPKAMEAIGKSFGKDVTTRNWKTIKRIEKKLDSY